MYLQNFLCHRNLQMLGIARILSYCIFLKIMSIFLDCTATLATCERCEPDNDPAVSEPFCTECLTGYHYTDTSGGQCTCR